MAFLLLSPALWEGWRNEKENDRDRNRERETFVCVSVELLDAVSQTAQKYEALYMGTLPVTKAMGEH